MPKLFMAEDQHIPCNANQVPKVFCMHCSLSETNHYIEYEFNVLKCFSLHIFKDYKVLLPSNFHYRFLIRVVYFLTFSYCDFLQLLILS